MSIKNCQEKTITSSLTKNNSNYNIESRKNTLPYPIANALTDDDEEAEEITKKIPQINIEYISTKSNLHAPYIRIILLKCKGDYQEFYTTNYHAIILKMESDISWFGIPVKGTYVGPVEWNKSVWECVFQFDITHELLRTLEIF